MIQDPVFEPLRTSAIAHGISDDEFNIALRFMSSCSHIEWTGRGSWYQLKQVHLFKIISDDLVIIIDDHSEESEISEWMELYIKNCDIIHLNEFRFIRMVDPKELMLFKLRWV